MRLHELVKSKWLHTKQKRRGRGNATGTGNYSGRGLKWQKARSGHSHKPFFEGGQTSIVQRLPKARGFTRYFKLVKDYQVINLGKLNQDERVSDTMEISKASLKKLWYIAHEKGLVKILGDGEYTKQLTFLDIDVFSASAKEKIAAPGKTSSKPSKMYRKIEKTEKKVVKKVKTSDKPVKKVEEKVAPKKELVEEKKVTPKKVVAKVEKPVEEKKTPVKKPATKVVSDKKPVDKKAPSKKIAPKKA